MDTIFRDSITTEQMKEILGVPQILIYPKKINETDPNTGEVKRVQKLNQAGVPIFFCRVEVEEGTEYSKKNKKGQTVFASTVATKVAKDIIRQIEALHLEEGDAVPMDAIQFTRPLEFAEQSFDGGKTYAMNLHYIGGAVAAI